MTRPHISVYIGDIHGSRLAPLKRALDELDVDPARLLCTMDLDQVLAIQELREYEAAFDARGRDALVVPGNHEDALVSGIEIDSGTYRKDKQETNIQELADALNRAENRSLLAYVASKLQIHGGLRFDLGKASRFPAIVIHGAFRGKEEKYLYEFSAQMQTHIRERGDMWLRLETGAHLQENFSAMRSSGVQVMIRGHDHFAAMRSLDAGGTMYGHDIVVNELEPDVPRQARKASRRADQVDEVEPVTTAEMSALGEREDFYWMPLAPDRLHVINFGPYFMGHFGLVRAATDSAPPAVAFCRTPTTHFNAADREEMLGTPSIGAQARAGKSFYDLFNR